LHPDGVISVIPESGSICLRRSSTIEAQNEALLFEENVAVVPVDKSITRTRASKLQRQSSTEEVEKATCKLEPRIEGRIVVLNEGTLPHLLSERQAWEKSGRSHQGIQ
jgi:5'-nucleotidase